MYEGLAASYARRLPSVALLRRAARGKPLGFPLNIARFCFVSSKQNLRVTYLTTPNGLACTASARRVMTVELPSRAIFSCTPPCKKK